ncbi:MAG: mechanosensitive ion channel domain-containing protein [Pseudomonadota bacterium]
MSIRDTALSILGTINGAFERVLTWSQSPDFYFQLAAVVIASVLAIALARGAGRHAWFQPPGSDASKLRRALAKLKKALAPLFAIVLLSVASMLSASLGFKGWLIQVAESLVLLYLAYTIVHEFVTSSFVRMMVQWIGVPIALLVIFGYLDDVRTLLSSESMTFESGGINLSVYSIAKALISGMILFWLGRFSNTAGKEAIRRQDQLDIGTREVFAKMFEIGVFVLIFVLLLQVMGINLTALAVFGGALGVGLGFGLQQIASNFISGIILLLDRSVTIGDHVELEDGRSGTLRELNMRFGILETYDGKDIVVPNEQFITSKYTNWTHKDPKQRYSIEFQVAYATDLDALFSDLRALCEQHPMVLSGDDYALEYQPDAEIAGFGDSGIDVLVEFWMDDIDDGKNRVGADLMLSIYHLFRDKEAYEFPFPQREIRILGGSPPTDNPTT